MSAIDCRLCGSQSNKVLEKTLLTYRVDYYLCVNCDLLQTEAPHWLDEAYQKSVEGMDPGAENRNVKSVGLTLALLHLLGKRGGNRFVDFGGGKGTFTKLMRERSYPFYSHDRYHEGVNAGSFQVEKAEGADVVTCFEVFEHFADVKEELGLVFAAKPSLVVVSTLLHWGVAKEWWYFSEETGQHIAFYSTRTMQWIADVLGYVVIPAHAYTAFIRKDQAPNKLLLTVIRKLLYRPELGAKVGYALDNIQKFLFTESKALSSK